MSPFATLLARDVKLAARSGGSAALALSFFALVATLVPLGVGADLKLLARVAGGILWVGAVLAALPASAAFLAWGSHEPKPAPHFDGPAPAHVMGLETKRRTVDRQSATPARISREE